MPPTQEEIIHHNKEQLSLMKEGDLIEFDRGVFSHWAVYIGKGIVVHVTPSDDSGVSSSSNCCSGRDKAKIVVKKDDFWKVAKNSKAFRNNNLDREMSPYSREQIVQRALKNLGKFGYDILSDNCEHFASWCRYGKKKSEQADNAITGIAIGGGAGLGVLAAGALIGIGVAAGRSNSKVKEKPAQR